MSSVFAVGVGPGSKNYITETVKEIILNADVVVGYQYTLNTITDLIKDKKVHVITMANQEKIYQEIKKGLGDKVLVVPFTGDVNFSESEVVDRLVEIFGGVEIIPGISSVQVAASKAKIPIDKSKVITMHVTTSIEEKKFQFGVVQDWVKYPLSAPTKFLKVDWSGLVKYIKDRQIVTK